MDAARHPRHVLENKFMVVEQLEKLLCDCRDSSNCLGPRQRDELAHLLLQVFSTGFKKRVPMRNHARQPPPLTDFWSALIDMLQITDAEVEACDTDVLYQNYDVLDSRVQRQFTKWFFSLLKNSTLHSCLAEFCQDHERVAEHYTEVSFFRVEEDQYRILNIFSQFQELPIRRLGKISKEMERTICVAKNNVLAVCPSSIPSSSTSPSSSPSSSPSPSPSSSPPPSPSPPSSSLRTANLQPKFQVDSGYFAIVETFENILPGPPSSESTVEDEDVVQYCLLWTPNAHFRALSGVITTDVGPIRDSSPLPDGWDQAFDPITGHNYYIDHNSGVTTWSKPTDHDGEISSIPGFCCCGSSNRPSTVSMCTPHRCSIQIIPGKEHPLKVYVNFLGADAGYVHILCSSEDGSPQNIVLHFKTGGISSILDILQKVKSCSIYESGVGHAILDKKSSTALVKQHLRRTPVSSPRPASMFGLDFESECVTVSTWKSFLDEKGRHTDWDSFRKLIFFRGLDPEARVHVWPFLFGLYPPYSTKVEQEEIFAKTQRSYMEAKNKWLLNPVAKAYQTRARIKDVFKDVLRTDREFEYYAGDNNENLAVLTDVLVTVCLEDDAVQYVQGMSDILAPMLMVLKNEAIAYNCFKTNLQRLLPYFDGGPGMSELLEDLRKITEYVCPDFYQHLCHNDMVNMFFCYRWMLLDFKREFALGDVLKVWETIWCKHRTDKFHIYVALAIMTVYDPSTDAPASVSNNLLEYYSNLAGDMDVKKVLTKARTILYQMRQLDLPETIASLNITNAIRGSTIENIGKVYFGDAEQTDSHDTAADDGNTNANNNNNNSNINDNKNNTNNSNNNDENNTTNNNNNNNNTTTTNNNNNNSHNNTTDSHSNTHTNNITNTTNTISDSNVDNNTNMNNTISNNNKNNNNTVSCSHDYSHTHTTSKPHSSQHHDNAIVVAKRNNEEEEEQQQQQQQQQEKRDITRGSSGTLSTTTTPPPRPATTTTTPAPTTTVTMTSSLTPASTSTQTSTLTPTSTPTSTSTSTPPSTSTPTSSTLTSTSTPIPTPAMTTRTRKLAILTTHGSPPEYTPPVISASQPTPTTSPTTATTPSSSTVFTTTTTTPTTTTTTTPTTTTTTTTTLPSSPPLTITPPADDTVMMTTTTATNAAPMMSTLPLTQTPPPPTTTPAIATLPPTQTTTTTAPPPPTTTTPPPTTTAQTTTPTIIPMPDSNDDGSAALLPSRPNPTSVIAPVLPRHVQDESRIDIDTVFTADLVAAAPASILDECRLAMQLDAARNIADAGKAYLKAIDNLLAHIRTIPKSPQSKIMKRFAKLMLTRAHHLKSL